MSSEATAALIAATVSIVGLLVTSIWNFVQQRVQQQQWQESFIANLRTDLIRESTVSLVELRLDKYGTVWESLDLVAGYRVRRSDDLRADVQLLADELTRHAYSSVGMIMSERSRQLLYSMRTACGDYLKGEISIEELQQRAHLLRHSLRSDMGIENQEYENELARIAFSVEPMAGSK